MWMGRLGGFDVGPLHALFLVSLALTGLLPLNGMGQIQSAAGKAEGVLLYDRDFAADASLVARPDQVLVFTPDQGESVGRFNLAAGTHRFCLSGGGGYFSLSSISNAIGKPAEISTNAEGCAQVNLRDGVATVRLNHSGAKPPLWVTATVRVDAPQVPATPLVDKTNSPVGGYWAIQDNTYNGRGTVGNHVYYPGIKLYLHVGPGSAFTGSSLIQFPQFDGTEIPALLGDPKSRFGIFLSNLLIGDSCWPACAYGSPPSLQVTDLGNYHFQFLINPKPSYPTSLAGQGLVEPMLRGDLSRADTFQVLFRFFPDGKQVKSLHDRSTGEVALFQQCDRTGKAAVFMPMLGNGVVSPPYDLRALTSSVTTLDGTAQQIDLSLGTGMYWGPDAATIQGAAVESASDHCLTPKPTGLLFVGSLAEVLVKGHDVIPLNACEFCSLVGQSMNLAIGSHQADFTLWDFNSANFSHSVLGGLNFHNAAMKDVTFVGATLTDVDLSVSQETSVTGLSSFSGATLTRVNLAGRNFGDRGSFRGAMLTDVDFRRTSHDGTLDFTGALLTNVNLTGLDPTSFNFAGATLCGVSLTGKDEDHILDLTSGNFAGAKVVLSSRCPADLSYTTFNAIVEPTGSWSGLNLTGATAANLQGTVLSTKAHPLDLSGAILKGSYLQNVVLDYATGLAGEDLTGIRLGNSSLRFVNLSEAKLYGAKLNQTNLEGANMKSVFLTKYPLNGVAAASLQGSFMRNVNLSQAKLSGADFTNASFYSQSAVGSGLCTPDPKTNFTATCATAAGATMDGTNFTDAYLFGVDFTGATATAVNFGGSFLTGANFSGTRISANPVGATGTFSSTFLQGASMGGMKLQNGVSFQGAFVDFTSDGNVLTLVLGGGHTTFPGYWNTPSGEQVCAQMTYSGPTTLPATDEQTTCPDGNQYAGGCGVAAVKASAPNPHWRSGIDVSSSASYMNNATYTNAPVSGDPICKADFKWIPLGFGGAPVPGALQRGPGPKSAPEAVSGSRPKPDVRDRGERP